IRDYIQDEAIIEMIRMVANDEISQPVAQAAAWHRTDDLSWEFLSTHNRRELSNGYFERFFAPEHLHWAQQVNVVAQQRAAARQADSPEDTWRSDR
ncbi:MAG: hypothetical protein ACR2NP_19990, partial [Pirellulaceae bacterium]